MTTPSAFPYAPPLDSGGGTAAGYPYPDQGMTLRDYFAAKALMGLLTKETWDQSGPMEFAKDAYMLADAMLTERDKP